MAVRQLPGGERGPERLSAGGREGLDAGEAGVRPRGVEERQRAFADHRQDPVVRQVADGHDDHRPLSGHLPDVGYDHVLPLRAQPVAALVEEDRRAGDQQHAGDEDGARQRPAGVALDDPQQQQREGHGRNQVRRLRQDADGADREIDAHGVEVDPVDRRGDEGGEDDEAEAVRAVLAIRIWAAEQLYAQRAEGPEEAADEEAADGAVDDRDGGEAAGGDVDLGIEEVEQMGHVEPEDGPGEEAFEEGPADLHARQSLLGVAQ